MRLRLHPLFTPRLEQHVYTPAPKRTQKRGLIPPSSAPPHTHTLVLHSIAHVACATSRTRSTFLYPPVRKPLQPFRPHVYRAQPRAATPWKQRAAGRRPLLFAPSLCSPTSLLLRYLCFAVCFWRPLRRLTATPGGHLGAGGRCSHLLPSYSSFAKVLELMACTCCHQAVTCFQIS